MNTYTIVIRGSGPAAEGEPGSEVATAQAAVSALVAAGHTLASADVRIDKGGEQHLPLT
jgi:hypothetical protein